MSDVAAAAELLQLATNVWRVNYELEQNSWASLIGHVRLEDAHAGVDVDERLVLVVPHRVQNDLLPVLEAYAEFAEDLERRMWGVAAAIDEAKAGR